MDQGIEPSMANLFSFAWSLVHCLRGRQKGRLFIVVGVVDSFEASDHFTHASVGPHGGQDLSVFTTPLDMGQLGKRHRFNRKRAAQHAFGVDSTVWSDFFVSASDPFGPRSVNLTDKKIIRDAAANMGGTLGAHVHNALLNTAPFITTLPNWLLNSRTRPRLSGQNLHLIKFVLKHKLDGGVSSKGSVQSIHVT